MDERSPRQPDSSGPPEDSGETGASEARPQNPYRIPLRPPEDEREETGGLDHGHRPPKAEPDAVTWDNPFHGSPLSQEWDDVELNTPWGAPVPGEEPRTDAFEAVGAPEGAYDPSDPSPYESADRGASADPGSVRGTDSADENGDRSAGGWNEAHATGAFSSVAPRGHDGQDQGRWDRSGTAADSFTDTGAFGSVAPREHEHEQKWDAWGRQDQDHWGSGPGTGAFTPTDTPEHWESHPEPTGGNDQDRDARGQQGQDHWGSGPDTGSSTGTFEAADVPGRTESPNQPGAYGHVPDHRKPTGGNGQGWDAWGRQDQDHQHWDSRPQPSWNNQEHEHRESRQEPTGDDNWNWEAWGRQDQDHWGSTPDTGAFTPTDTPEHWESHPEPTGGNDQGWDAWGRQDQDHQHWGSRPQPSWNNQEHEHRQYSHEPAHDENRDRDAWGQQGQDHQHWAPGPSPAWGAAAGATAGAAAWDRYGEGENTGFYGHSHEDERGWDAPRQDRPGYEEDTPYPGVSAGPPASERHGAVHSGGRGGDDGYGGGHGGDGWDEGDDYEGDDYDGDGYGDDRDPAPGKRKSRKGLLFGVGAVVLVLALVGGGVGWYVWNMPEPHEATDAFAAAWEAQDYESLAEHTTGDDAAEVLGGIDTGLGVDSISVDVEDPVVDGGEGSAAYEVTVSLTNADNWGWEGELPLLREDGQWWVDFSPEVAYPELAEGQVLARTAVWGERGHVLAADGTRLDSPEASGSLQMIAGSLGEADEDDVERLGAAYSVGDTIGVDGLQRTYEEHLAGEAATTIVIADAQQVQDEESVEATEDNTVATLDGSDGEDIVTSIDMDIQSTAAGAIIDADDPAGMVALRPSTGEILAAVNVPGGFNRAFEGQYPPGSSFKIVSYSALLDNGMPADETMDCPEEYELGGWPFRNANEAEYGSQSVTEAFATSCNTALIAELGDRINGEQLQASAEQFGMNQPLDIGVTTHEPVFPAIDSATALGSQGIGQGQILTSPLHMATVSAAIADGSWRHPVLVSDPEPEELPEPNPVAHAEAIRPMMRAVITDGTAEDLDFEGEVFGKTGTAEYGTAEDADDDDELPSHAWMIGYKGDVAFALVIEGGGGGAADAGPLAADFTNGLP